MAPCTLDVGSRRVLVSEEGPPAAEFALFDPSDIELAPGEDGALREAGYRTTATNALRRLAMAGITRDFAEECARLVRGKLAETYARGPTVRRIVGLLGPAELFDGGTYDATLRRYDGTFLDLPLLANDAGIASATGVLQAASLVSLLSEVMGETVLVLHTLGHSESLRLGERTLRRHAIAGAAGIPRALRQLAEHPPSAPAASAGPTNEVIAEIIRSRLNECAEAEARDHLARIERALRERTRPNQGPLSDPTLWDAERLLWRGETAQAIARIEAYEASQGRDPATLYLRARASLATGREAPKLIAQRVGELALTMSNFPEVELLAAQAWAAAGDMRRAIPFARDLLANPRLHDELRFAAEIVVRGAKGDSEGPVGEHAFEASPTGELRPISKAPPPSRAAQVPPPSAAPPRSERPEPSLRRPDLTNNSPIARSVPPPVSGRDPRAEPQPPPAEPTRRTLTPPEPPRAARPRDIPRYLTPPERAASPLPPRSGQTAPPARSSVLPAPPASIPPPTQASPAPVVPPNLAPNLPVPSLPSLPITPQAFKRMSEPPAPNVRIEEPPPPPGNNRGSEPPPRPGSEPPSAPRPSPRVVQPEGWPTSLRAPREEVVRPEEIEHTPAAPRTTSSTQQRFMRGASLPPTRSEPVAPVIPRAPVVPRVDIDEAELVETLPLPRGAAEVNLDPNTVPRNPLEARARFTMESRELARRYRREEGLELRLEPRALLLLQRRLVDRFPNRLVTTPDEAREAELHGAFLSELLARLLDAEWVDVSPSELGYWAMVIPAKGSSVGKRVWPFGRVLRFVSSGGEDDLAAFFRKLRES